MGTVLAVKNGGGTWILSDGDSVTDNTDANDNDTSPIGTTSGAFDNFLFNKAFKILMVLSFSITPFPLLVCGFKVGKNMDNNNAGNDDDDDGTVAPFITVLYHQQLY